jgi:hypothetical protein
MRRARVANAIGGVLVLGFVGLNVAAYRQARAFTHLHPTVLGRGWGSCL